MAIKLNRLNSDQNYVNMRRSIWKDCDNSGGTIEAVPFIWPPMFHHHRHNQIYDVTQAVAWPPSPLCWKKNKQEEWEQSKNPELESDGESKDPVASPLCPPAVAGGYSRPICVIVLLVDIKSWAMLAKRGCAFVWVSWRECAIVHPPPWNPLLFSSIYLLTLSTTVFACLWASSPSICVWLCVCETEGDAFFIHPAVLFCLTQIHTSVFYY